MTTPTIEEMRKRLEKVWAALAVDVPLNESDHAWRLWEELRDARSALASALEQLEAARKALFEFGDHMNDCAILYEGGICNCGFGAALATLPPAPEVTMVKGADGSISFVAGEPPAPEVKP